MLGAALGNRLPFPFTVWEPGLAQNKLSRNCVPFRRWGRCEKEQAGGTFSGESKRHTGGWKDRGC